MEIYITRPGDSLNSIAKAYGISVRQLAQLNQLGDPSRLASGLSLILPCGKWSVPAGCELCAALSPKAAVALTDELLPALTWLCIQSASFTRDGQIFMPEAEGLLAKSRVQGAVPILTLSNLGASGFSPELGHSIIYDLDAVARLRDNLISLLAAQGYGGMALNFQYLPDFDRQRYIDFGASLGAALHDAGLYLFCCLSPKALGAEFGAFADRIILLCHGYGGIDTPPQAIAPLWWVDEAVAMAVGLLPRERLLLSVSAYGCSWALPWRQGRWGEYLPCSLAVDMAVAWGSEIRRDNSTGAAFFTASTKDIQRAVYYDDCTSVAARLNLAQGYGLGGVELYTRDSLYRPAVELVKSRLWGEKMVE